MNSSCQQCPLFAYSSIAIRVIDERQTLIETQTGAQTHRHTNKHAHTHTQAQTQTQTDKHTDKCTHAAHACTGVGRSGLVGIITTTLCCHFEVLGLCNDSDYLFPKQMVQETDMTHPCAIYVHLYIATYTRMFGVTVHSPD